MTPDALVDILNFVATPEFRRRWWVELERDQPKVAARLVAKFPERYPIRETA